ncbi:MAG: hypothetical protein V4642_02595 [Bacteroidota bacterium]
MRILLKIVFAFVIIFSQTAYCQTADDTTRFKTFWHGEFAETILKKDSLMFRYHSLSYIQCRECLTNTAAERAEAVAAKKLKIVTTGTLILDHTEHIPFKMFFKNDYGVIFDSVVVSRLRDSAMVEYRFRIEPIPKHVAGALKLKTKSMVYTALVVAVDATEKLKRKRYGFSFLKTKNGFTLFRIIAE